MANDEMQDVRMIFCQQLFFLLRFLTGEAMKTQCSEFQKIDLLHVRDAQRLMERGILVLDGPTEYEVFLRNSGVSAEHAHTVGAKKLTVYRLDDGKAPHAGFVVALASVVHPYSIVLRRKEASYR